MATDIVTQNRALKTNSFSLHQNILPLEYITTDITALTFLFVCLLSHMMSKFKKKNILNSLRSIYIFKMFYIIILQI